VSSTVVRLRGEAQLTHSLGGRIDIRNDEIPAEYLEAAKVKRAELVEAIAEVDDELTEAWLEEREITPVELGVRPPTVLSCRGLR